MSMYAFRKYEEMPPEEAVFSLLGVTSDDLQATALQCFRMAASAGPLQPKGAKGTLAWIYGTEHIRSQLIPKGWRPEDVNNQPRVVSPDGRHAITVICGDPNTGNPHREPLTRNKRGTQTSRSVHYNAAQTDMFPVEQRQRQAFTPDDMQEKTLWILLFHVDIENRVVFFELSRPINMGDNGKVDGWMPRFIMSPLYLDRLGDDPFESGPDLDVPVIPR